MDDLVKHQPGVQEKTPGLLTEHFLDYRTIIWSQFIPLFISEVMIEVCANVTLNMRSFKANPDNVRPPEGVLQQGYWATGHDQLNRFWLLLPEVVETV